MARRHSRTGTDFEPTFRTADALPRAAGRVLGLRSILHAAGAIPIHTVRLTALRRRRTLSPAPWRN